MNDNLYDILKINKTATKSEIKKSFIKLAKMYHPDKNKNNNTNDEFIKLKSAYDILIDDNTRNKYDSLNEINKLSLFQSIIDIIKQKFPNINTYIKLLLSKKYEMESDIKLDVQCDLLDRYLDNYALVEIERNTKESKKVYIPLKNDINIFIGEGEYINNYHGNVIIKTETINLNGFKIYGDNMSKILKINKKDYDNDNIIFEHIDCEKIKISKNNIENKYIIIKEKGLPIQDNNKSNSNLSRGDLVIYFD